MDKQTYKVLVPHDFTNVADCAINHASKIANSFSGEVYLLHVVSKDKEIAGAKEKLTQVAERAEASNSGVKFNVLVRIGNIFEDIGDVASEIGAGFIVMGTHGAKGMQKIMGSYALRVISHSKVPFVICQTQDPKQTDTYDDIVVPIDYSDVTKQKLTVAANIASHFGSKIHLFYDIENDEFLKKKLDRELSFAKNYFLDRKISYTLNQAEIKGQFKKQLVIFAAKIDADLICIVNQQEGALLPDFFGSDEQIVIANEAEIPVIITNPTQQVVAGGVLGT
ncbi:MAG: universal stress protein [Flavobacteriales bacterium]|nr:universal stress protein [Flavobacteriales bacterium]MCB9335770.1 universal stress protein [Flavobacteriales bacterium]